MKEYTIKNFKVKAKQMTRFDYEYMKKPSVFINPEWKLWDGYFIDGYGGTFWKDERLFHELFEEVSDAS